MRYGKFPALGPVGIAGAAEEDGVTAGAGTARRGPEGGTMGVLDAGACGGARAAGVVGVGGAGAERPVNGGPPIEPRGCDGGARVILEGPRGGVATKPLLERSARSDADICCSRSGWIATAAGGCGETPLRGPLGGERARDGGDRGADLMAGEGTPRVLVPEVEGELTAGFRGGRGDISRCGAMLRTGDGECGREASTCGDGLLPGSRFGGDAARARW